MKRSLPVVGVAAIAMLILVGVVTREAMLAEPESDTATLNLKPVKRVKSQLLGGNKRLLTHLSTDKPIYREGETVYGRGVMLNALTRKPASHDQWGIMEITGPKGDVVAAASVYTQDSVYGFPWKVPEGQAGGEYTIRVTHPGTGQPPAERTFDVRAYRAPRLKTQIVFVRDGYGPGDKDSASMSVERAEGGIPVGAPVTVIGRVDGTEVFRGPASVDKDGVCSAAFQLPKKIERGEGTLAFVVEDGGVVETASKTIPILLQTVDLRLYPEGGDLIAGLKSRVYFEAKTPVGKPADLAGVIVNKAGKTVARFRSKHEGRGSFQVTPKLGESYRFKITEPTGIKTTFPLPELKDDGVVISTKKQTYAAGGRVKVTVSSVKSRPVTVTLAKREVEVAAAQIRLDAGKTQSVVLTPPATADGVLVATVWDANGNALAERLLFRQPQNSINVDITADRSKYVPGGTATLKLRTTDSSGAPVSAVVGVTVTDDSVLEMIEKREQTPRLPVMVLLEDEVQDLADAHVYLDQDNPEANQAVDLLLGTQGWRRFSFVDVGKFIESHDDNARRVLALRMASALEEPGSAAGFGGGPVRDFGRFAEDGGLELEEEKRAVEKRPGEGQAAPPANLPKAAPPRGQVIAEKNEAAAERPVAAAAPPVVAREPRAAGKPLPAASRPQTPAQAKLKKQLDQAAFRRRKNAFGLEADAIAGNVHRQVSVRVYAHKIRANRQAGARLDFAETLFWHAGVKTSENGEATVTFDLSDSVTSFKVAADAFDANGALGSGTSTIESVEPFYIEPKLPLEVTQHDAIDVPFAMVNATDETLPISAVEVSAPGAHSVDLPVKQLAPGQRVRGIISIDVGDFSGTSDVVISAAAGAFRDQVTRPLKVVPLGFPVEIAHGGMLYADETVAHEVVIPEHIVPGSITTEAKVFPTPLGNLTAALQRLIREPYGCFEQTSSSTYPLIMAQQYFQSHTGVDPSMIERSNSLLEKGYKRLIGFECKGGGFEWFGADPGHEALTAYGLMEFTDMSKVRDVDTEMLARTREWLLSTRDGKGGFKRERRALHTWVTNPDVSNAYITWALQNAGETNLGAEVQHVINSAMESENTYVVALGANVAVIGGDQDSAEVLRDRLIKLQESDGSLRGATQSIVGSGGMALTIEATALAALAWIPDVDYIDHADAAIRYLAGACKAGRYGSTQSTVLALKAIVEYDKSQAKPKSPGSVQLVIDGKTVGEPLPFDRSTEGTIELPQFGKHLKPGKHTIGLKMVDGSSMPHALAINLFSTKPASSEECQVQVETRLSDAETNEGDVTEVDVTVTNLSDKVVPNPVSLIGIPGGLEVRHDQLKELVKAKKIAAYEVIGRDVVLYWRELAADAKVRLPISVVAAVPGEFTGPASRTYLYYTDEHKHWASGLKVSIQAKR